jgi:glucose-1-phosphate cytidylyltransferase
MTIDPTAPVAILCGGRGTRLQEHSQALPKPLVEIGGRPILWHVIQIYAVQGFTRFLLCTGHRRELIERFADQQRWPDGVEVTCVDTGVDTPTGGRIKRLQPELDGRSFYATYADGVADVDLGGLSAYHSSHGDLATMTVVRPTLGFGIAELDGHDGRVRGFHEKPRSEHWINGGFFCFEPGVFEYLTESSVLEREPLEGLVEDGQLRAFRHTGFWKCMDTYKDAAELNDLWESGHPPWRLWAPDNPT